MVSLPGRGPIDRTPPGATWFPLDRGQHRAGGRAHTAAVGTEGTGMGRRVTSPQGLRSTATSGEVNAAHPPAMWRAGGLAIDESEPVTGREAVAGDDGTRHPGQSTRGVSHVQAHPSSH